MAIEYWTVKEYATRTGQTHQNVYKLIQTGKLSTVQEEINGRMTKVIVVDTDHLPRNTGAQKSSSNASENGTSATANMRNYATEIEELKARIAAQDKIIEEYRQQINDYAEKFFKLADQAQTLQLAAVTATMPPMKTDPPTATAGKEPDSTDQAAGDPAENKNPAPSSGSIWDAIRRWWRGV